MGINENVGSAVSLASTGLIVLGASVPLRMLQQMKPRRKKTRRRRK
jgi:hypothetical protein